MKAKLSFLAPLLNRGLAPSLCLGLVITLVIAACSSDGGTKNPDPGPGPNGGYSSGSNTDAPGEIIIKNFEVDNTGERWVEIRGSVEAAAADPIVRVSYSISSPGKLSWILLDGNGLTGPITDVGTGVSFDLFARIDLKNNNEIPCGQDFYINVEAYTKKGTHASRSDPKYKFSRPDVYCQLNSSGGGEQSSSSVAVWRFGPPADGQARAENSYTIPIGGGSASFKLLGDGDIVDQPDLQMTGGTIKQVTPCNDDGTVTAGTGGDVQVGTPYSSKESCLGSTRATATKVSQIDGLEGIQPKQDYYLVYLDDNSGVYLLFFTVGDGGDLFSWPLKYIIWPATEKP